MSAELTSPAEQKAQTAEHLPAFEGLNLLYVKRQVALLLGQIGGHGIFDEYTRHDISHIDTMLRNLTEIIIPQHTQEIMSTADWLMIVLAVYFHDLGMLVTKTEYARRNQSDFPRFRDAFLFSDDDTGKDYKARVNSLPEDERERFLYQEFVRENHAARIRYWVSGSARDHLGLSDEVAGIVNEILDQLDRYFRQSLGMVCESHHLDDLDDFNKYSVSEPFGASEAETANLQYAAILLRTADLLHITRDRTPSILFKALNPADPISQREWAKQMAVRSVRSQIARDSEGNADPQLDRDTIEVHAHFTDEDGFFGLTSYLDYAQKQLKLSHDWVAAAQKQHAVPHRFPWVAIDQSHIETEGFLRQQFEFTIDQARILDLLTGHTLYNDTSVVLRELVQNSVDAVRLRFFDPTGAESRAQGRVIIEWDSASRKLSVTDNGTGMSQDVIENHLLKVGASRYQDPKFKESHPDFTPISRFGIGVLSAFMIADEVEIITSEPGDQEARRLLLRSVHGKYLIRTLDKRDSAIPAAIVDHGTRFTLTVRPSANISRLEEVARRWVVVPDCEVLLKVDDSELQRIGFDRLAEALDYIMRTSSVHIPRYEQDPRRFKIVERTVGTLTLAFAVQWSDYFRQWSFVRLSEPRGEQARRPPELGVCIEGIRVSFASPGFTERNLCAIANATGRSAPRTTVARSAFEATAEYEAVIRACYQIYVGHVREEILSLQRDREFSLTWTVNEAPYLLFPLLDDDVQPNDRKLLLEVAATVPSLVTEVHGVREAVSLNDLETRGGFWTVDCELFRSAERLLREVAGSQSLRALVDVIGSEKVDLPEGVLLCSAPAFGQESQLFDSMFEPSRVVVDRERRRIDFLWTSRTSVKKWIIPDVDWPRPSMEALSVIENLRLHPRVVVYRPHGYGYQQRRVWIPKEGINFDGFGDESAVVSQERILLLPKGPLVNWLNGLDIEESGTLAWIFVFLLREALHPGGANEEILEEADTQLFPKLRQMWDDKKTLDSIQAELAGSSWKVMDTSLWYRRMF